MPIFVPPKIMAAIIATSVLLAAPAAADVKKGYDAWMSGDHAGAISEWRPLAEKGDADAQFNMGQAYRLGMGAPVDPKLAQSWYERAAAQGHQKAQIYLGPIMFQNGDRKAAMPWIRKAADAGDVRSQYILGISLFNGELIEKDWPRAYALMTRASAQGLPPAAAGLEQMNQHMPLADREKGLALARQMESAPVLASASAAPDTNAVMAAPSRPPVQVAATAPPPPKALPAAPKPAPPKPMSAAARPVPAPAVRPAPTAVAARGAWRVQFGAYNSPAAARAQWGVLSRKMASLSSMQPSYEQFGKFTRLRVGTLANRAAADKMCAAAVSAGQACFTVAP